MATYMLGSTLDNCRELICEKCGKELDEMVQNKVEVAGLTADEVMNRWPHLSEAITQHETTCSTANIVRTPTLAAGSSASRTSRKLAWAKARESDDRNRQGGMKITDRELNERFQAALEMLQGDTEPIVQSVAELFTELKEAKAELLSLEAMCQGELAAREARREKGGSK